MKVTITSIKLKTVFHFFPLSAMAIGIMKQIKKSQCIEIKTTGIWTTHYTMTLWKNQDDINAFAKSGNHLQSMKKSKSIAKEISVVTVDANTLPDWPHAKRLLEMYGDTYKF